MQGPEAWDQTVGIPLKSVVLLTLLTESAKMLNCNYKYPSNAVISKPCVYFSGRGSC